MSHDAKDNENWGECPKCGSPVLIDPATNTPETCSQCASQASGTGLYLGGFAVIMAIIAIALLVYFCIRVLRP